MQALEHRHRGIIEAWQWVQANQARFRGRVYGPIAVEVECPDPQHLQYLEQHVSGEPRPSGGARCGARPRL